MKRFIFSAVVSAVGAAGLAITVAAQTPPASAQTPSAKGSASEQQVTLVGCLQREADYRKSKDAGKGGVAGTGVGAGNEFVLINASASKGSTPGATGTSGMASGSLASAYELTGSGEGQASQYIGKRVEVTGMLKAAETSASGRPTGGATAGQPPSGVDVASKDLKLREFEVSSIKESTGSCPSE